MKKILVLLFATLNLLLADTTTGSATILTFLDELPLQNNAVVVDGSDTYYTDEDGAVEIILETGKHQIEIFAKDDQDYNLGYVKTHIIVKEDRDTQVIVTFKEDGIKPVVDIDTPVGSQEPLHVNTKFATLQAHIFSEETKKPVVGAHIFVQGSAQNALSDAQGFFTLQIPADNNVTLSIVHSQYATKTLRNVHAKEKQILKQKIYLVPASMELEEFVVLAPQVQGSIATIMAEEKKANAITNIIGSEQISKQGDSSAAGAIRRVTGVTLVDGTDVYVRGLGGRYSNVEMNSMPLPSPDPQRRTIPLDIFPSAVIGSMKVQKSATADIPASFGGGYVDIRTKGKQKENYLKITTELKANSYTGKEVNTYHGSATDWMGSDDGYRQIPAQILNDSKIVVGERVPNFDPANQEAYQKGITNRLYTTYKEPLPFGGKFALEGAYNYKIANKHSLSFFANYTYEQIHLYRDEEYFSYAYNQSTDSLYTTPEQYGMIQRTQDIYKNALIANIQYNYADAFKIKYTKLISKVSEKVTKIADGIANSDDDWKIRYDLNWEERTLDTNQISGDFKYKIYDYTNKFSFGLENAEALLDQPNNYKYTYLRDIDFNGVVQGPPYFDRFSPNVFLNMTSTDKLNALYMKNKTDIELFNEGEYFEMGMSMSAKTRESRYNKYFMQKTTSDVTDRLTQDIDTIYDEHVRNYDETFNLNISFQPAYWYDAQVDENSYFAKMLLKPSKKLEVLVGARATDFSQVVYQYTNDNNVFTPIYKKPETLEFKEILPSGSLKYSFDKSNTLSFAFSQTYIVPDLREFTEAEYFHPYEVATVKGNPNLVNTDIYSYDLKYTHYFSDAQKIGFGTFYKYLDKPIEDVMLPSSSLPRYGYDNADNAVLYGFEIDGRKELNFVYPQLKHYFMSGNFSYTYSDVTLKEEQTALYTTNHRQLQGLSPTVLNLSLSYEVKNRSATLSYNKMGERIRKVGMIDAQDEYPDYYEVPPAVLDFVWIEKYKNGMSWKLKIKNILDEETIWYQGSKANITNRFKVGRFYTFAVSYKY